jgi:hypothetical protein
MRSHNRSNIFNSFSTASHSDSDLSRSHYSSQFSPSIHHYGLTSAFSTPAFSSPKGKSPSMMDIKTGSNSVSPAPRITSPAFELERAREELKGRLSPINPIMGGKNLNAQCLSFFPRGNSHGNQNVLHAPILNRRESIGSPLRNEVQDGRNSYNSPQQYQQNGFWNQNPVLIANVLNNFIHPPSMLMPNQFGFASNENIPVGPVPFGYENNS